MKTQIKQSEEMVDVVILFVDDLPKGMMRETEVMNYRGNVWWDYIERYTITKDHYENGDLHSIHWMYTQK